MHVRPRRWRNGFFAMRPLPPNTPLDMYGMVNNAIKELILAEYGPDIWQQVKSRAEVEDEVFLSNEPYPDEITYRLIQATSSELEVAPEAVLHRFGMWWVLKTGREGYGHLMNSGGKTLREFLINLPNFHTRIMMMFPELRPPEFECEDTESGALRLHYRSTRKGLAPFVGGLLQGLAEMFETSITVKHEESVESGADHDVFVITWDSSPSAS